LESPFRSEAAAFRFLLITIGAFALIVAAAWIDPWLGFAVFVLLSAAAVGVYLRERSPGPPPAHVEHVGPPDVRRILVVANETVVGEKLMTVIGDLALAGQSEFFVVSPALNSRLRTWTSDEDGARAVAQKRLDATLERLESVGIEARGTIGDLDPLVAIEDAVRTFHPDEIVISTHPEGRSNWLERGIVVAVRERFDLPVQHVVVDLEVEVGRKHEPAGS
jgi:GABA permease